MCFILCDQKRLAEKDFFALDVADMMLFPILFDSSLIPIETFNVR